jgi:hypothetical protein
MSELRIIDHLHALLNYLDQGDPGKSTRALLDGALQTKDAVVVTDKRVNMQELQERLPKALVLSLGCLQELQGLASKPLLLDSRAVRQLLDGMLARWYAQNQEEIGLKDQLVVALAKQAAAERQVHALRQLVVALLTHSSARAAKAPVMDKADAAFLEDVLQWALHLGVPVRTRRRTTVGGGKKKK